MWDRGFVVYKGFVLDSRFVCMGMGIAWEGCRRRTRIAGQHRRCRIAAGAAGRWAVGIWLTSFFGGVGGCVFGSLG